MGWKRWVWYLPTMARWKWADFRYGTVDALAYRAWFVLDAAADAVADWRARRYYKVKGE